MILCRTIEGILDNEGSAQKEVHLQIARSLITQEFKVDNANENRKAEHQCSLTVG